MSRSILIVDDDAIIRLLLQTHFTRRGFTCIMAGDGAEALAVLEHRRVDVLITDLDMPGLDGLGLLEAVRTRGLITRCVVVTGYATLGNLTLCLREGASALIPKPLADLTSLDQAVDEAFAQMQRWTDQINAIMRLRPQPDGTGALEPRSDHAR
jgi:CheY-like chemotaxis protein